jgi:hypothetical protein
VICNMFFLGSYNCNSLITSLEIEVNRLRFSEMVYLLKIFIFMVTFIVIQSSKSSNFTLSCLLRV